MPGDALGTWGSAGDRVTLGRSPDLLEPQFLRLSTGRIASLACRDWGLGDAGRGGGGLGLGQLGE